MPTRYGNSKPSSEIVDPSQSLDDVSRREWVSVTAVAWVIDDAPVPADLALTLVVIARRCDQYGRGSYQANATMAEKTGKSEKQVRRDVIRLRALGLLKLGDQSLVAHLPTGQRPTVYDLPIDMKGPKPGREARNKLGVNTPRTPPMQGTPPMEGRGAIEGSPTPPMDSPGTPPLEGTPTPPMHGSQRTLMKNPLQPFEEPSLSRAVGRLGREREPDQAEKPEDQGHPLATQRRYLAPLVAKYRQGADPDWVDRLIRTIEDTHNVNGRGWWHKVATNGDLAGIVEELHDLVDVITPPGRAKPWCGRCDRRTRQISTEDNYGRGVITRACPACSDKAKSPAPPKCGRCDEHRMVRVGGTDEEPTVMRCPDCNPNHGAKPLGGRRPSAGATRTPST